MKAVNTILIFTILVGGLMFGRTQPVNPRVEENKIRIKSENYWVKDHSDNSSDNQLDRKRSHKRRRKIRKPVKGLR